MKQPIIHIHIKILSLSADSDSKVIRGEESGVTRVYSVAEAEKFIKANTESLPTIEKKWDFAENTTATEGENVPVVSGSAAWNETNQNIKFNANVTAPGTLSLKLNPAIGNKANVNFDCMSVHWADRRLHTRLMTVRVQIL